jgi:hypothetical protein
MFPGGQWRKPLAVMTMVVAPFFLPQCRRHQIPRVRPGLKSPPVARASMERTHHLHVAVAVGDGAIFGRKKLVLLLRDDAWMPAQKCRTGCRVWCIGSTAPRTMTYRFGISNRHRVVSL